MHIIIIIIIIVIIGENYNNNFNHKNKSTSGNLLAKKDVVCPVKFVKFQNVNTVQIFVQENGGSEVTELKNLEIFGTTGESSDLAAWKPVKG